MLQAIDIETCFDPVFFPPDDSWDDYHAGNITRLVGSTRYLLECSFDGAEPLIGKLKRLIFDGERTATR